MDTSTANGDKVSERQAGDKQFERRLDRQEFLVVGRVGLLSLHASAALVFRLLFWDRQPSLAPNPTGASNYPPSPQPCLICIVGTRCAI